MAELDHKSLRHLEKLLEKTQEAFRGLSARWEDLHPRKEFDVKLSEDFHLGYVFGKLEEDFVGWFYSQNGRSMTDEEYKQFWGKCRKLVRTLHQKYDMFYFQE